jgi:small-conductance mechanosensitive channel
LEEAMLTVKEQLMVALGDMFTGAVNAVPRAITGIAFVLLALIVAKVIERTLRRLLTRIKLDSLLSRVRLDQILSQLGIRAPLSQVLPRIIYYLLLFLFARAVIDALGIAVLSQTMGAFLGYLPNLVAAILILVLGGAGGQVAGRAVANAAESSGIEYGSSLGTAVSSLILFIAGIMALGQLQIDTDIVRSVTVGLLAGMALAFGLSFGLGTRDITRNLVAGFYARKVLRIGERLEIRGEEGVLRSITPTLTLLERDGRTVAISNGAFLQDTARQ